MRRYIFLFVILCSAFLSCKGPQKAVSYNDLYSEKPLTIYVAPIADNAERRVVKYPGDTKYNNEIDLAAKYMFQTAQKPIANQGYYVIGPAASMQIASEETRSQDKMMIGDLKSYKSVYGIDAILFPSIHKWAQEQDEWIVYVEYVLVSTTSNSELMHVWVKGSKLIQLNFKGVPQTSKFDAEFAADMELSNASAQRCFLVEQVNDYVLRNLPTSSDRRQFEEDRYFKAHPSYFSYYFSEDGTIQIDKITMEQYEQECFVNE